MTTNLTPPTAAELAEWEQKAKAATPGVKTWSIYVLVDAKTGEELAAHGENGPTLRRWWVDLEQRGFEVKLVKRREKNEPDT